MSDTKAIPEKPLSPHLQVYRLPMTALMSISHRATGAALAAGLLLVTAFLVAAALGKDYYDMVAAFAVTPLGTAVLVAWSGALYYHMCNGIRHLFWDAVMLLEPEQARAAGWLVILVALGLTLATWCLASPSFPVLVDLIEQIKG